MSKNDITGDKLISKTNSKQYDANYDAIFAKKDKPVLKEEPREDLVASVKQLIQDYEVGHKQYTDEQLFSDN